MTYFLGVFAIFYFRFNFFVMIMQHDRITPGFQRVPSLLSLSPFRSVFVSLSLSLCLSPPYSHFRSLSPSVSLFISLSVSVSVSLSRHLCTCSVKTSHKGEAMGVSIICLHHRLRLTSGHSAIWDEMSQLVLGYVWLSHGHVPSLLNFVTDNNGVCEYD